uniref:Uncharacterized protein n=2 Tax=Astyanax mexicanus TaxID=7994 RepID=A0A3B1J7H7_ASTMX
VVPFPIIHLLVDGPSLGGARTHIKQQIQMAVQHLNGEEVHLEREGALGLLGLLLGSTVAEEKKPVGFSGAEVEGDGAGLFGVPFVQRDEGFWRFESDGVQSGYVLALEGHHTVDLHLGIAL